MHQPNHDSSAAQGQDADAPPAEPGLLVAERRQRILELLRDQGRVTVEDLAGRFATSQVTIRTDLATLEAGGALERTHGGALLRREDDDQPIAVKQTRHHAEKVRIAKIAASLIQDGETLILDSGTTTAEIAKQIRRLEVQSINVITNALNIAVLLADAPTVRLIMLGGILRPESNSLSGPIAEAALGNLQADRLFLGADGVDPERGVMTPHLAEAQLNAQMIAISRQVVVVADSSKMMRRNISLIARVEQLHMLITDTGASPAVVAGIGTARRGSAACVTRRPSGPARWQGFQLIIFDCDGVLVDSEFITNRVYAAKLNELGIPGGRSMTCSRNSSAGRWSTAGSWSRACWEGPCPLISSKSIACAPPPHCKRN